MGWIKISHVNGNKKKPGIATLRENFKIKTVTRDRERHYIIMNKSIQ